MLQITKLKFNDGLYDMKRNIYSRTHRKTERDRDKEKSAQRVVKKNQNRISHCMEASSTHSYAQNKTPSFETNNSKQST